MHYDVARTAKGWVLNNMSSLTTIGTFTTRKQAVLTARLLAGWRGLVTVNGKVL